MYDSESEESDKNLGVRTLSLDIQNNQNKIVKDNWAIKCTPTLSTYPKFQWCQPLGVISSSNLPQGQFTNRAIGGSRTTRRGRTIQWGEIYRFPNSHVTISTYKYATYPFQPPCLGHGLREGKDAN